MMDGELKKQMAIGRGEGQEAGSKNWSLRRKQDTSFVKRISSLTRALHIRRIFIACPPPYSDDHHLHRARRDLPIPPTSR